MTVAAAQAAGPSADGGILDRALDRAWFDRHALDVATDLLGKQLVHETPEGRIAGKIVETEAYAGPEDLAAHSSRGRTARNAVMFGEPGHLYVYFIYGMHHCLNLAVDLPGVPGCVLVRALEPLPGQDLSTTALAGPGRLCRALGLDTRHSGRHLFDRALGLTLREGQTPARVAVSKRIGIRKAAARPLRFFDPSSAALSYLK